MQEHYDTVVIGGSQAGLATAYYLKKEGRSFVVLDAHDRIGDAWRARWDSLRLFTPAKYDGLPGMPFPSGSAFPTKDEMGDYLEAYAARFALPVRTGVRVDRLAREDGAFVVTSGDRRIESERVVVATGAHQSPRVPAIAAGLDPRIVQLHSSEYRGPQQLRDGGALVVGAGNSGAEIALELARTRPTWLSGRDVGEIPVQHGSRRGRLFLPVIRFMGHHVLTVRTPLGRKVGPKIARGATPLIRTKGADLREAGVERRGRAPRARRRPGARRAERRLVYGVRPGPLMDRSPGVRRRRAPASPPRRGRGRTRPLFRRPALPVRRDVGRPPGRRP
jgi:putative flavoprotein involved in K+ transport